MSVNETKSSEPLQYTYKMFKQQTCFQTQMGNISAAAKSANEQKKASQIGKPKINIFLVLYETCCLRVRKNHFIIYLSIYLL